MRSMLNTSITLFSYQPMLEFNKHGYMSYKRWSLTTVVFTFGDFYICFKNHHHQSVKVI